jgi:hypothetical protein
MHSVGQRILPGQYGSLIFSNYMKNLPSQAIYIENSFTPGTALGSVPTADTIEYNGTGAQTVSGYNYANLIVTGSRGGAAVTFDPFDSVHIANAFILNATSLSYVTTGSTIDYDDNGPQTVVTASGFSYYNLSFSYGGTKTISASSTLTAGGNVTINPGATLSIPSTSILNVTGTFKPDGALVNTGVINVGP